MNSPKDATISENIQGVSERILLGHDSTYLRRRFVSFATRIVSHISPDKHDIVYEARSKSLFRLSFKKKLFNWIHEKEKRNRGDR